MADAIKDPLSAVKDTSLFQRALELGLQADTPEFYHFMGLAPGNKGYEHLKKSKDVGYSDQFLDSITQGRHLQEYRDLAGVQSSVSDIYRKLQVVHEAEKLKNSGNPFLGDLFAPSQPGRAAMQGTPGNFQQLAGAIRQPLDLQTMGESPLQLRQPAPPDIRGGFMPSPLTQLQMPTSGAPAMPPRQARLGALPLSPDVEPMIQNLAAKGMRVSPQDLHQLAGIVAPSPNVKASTQDALQRHYLATGNIEGLEILGDVREKWKVDKDEANKLGDILTAAKVNKDSPQWKAAFNELAKKLTTHPPAAQQQMIMKQESAESAKVGAGFGEDFVTMQRAATSANTKLSKLDRMQSLMEGVTTGKLIPTMTELESLGKTLGFTVNPTLPAKQALTALSNEIALEMRSTGEGNGMPGALSDKDREFLVAMTPNLSTTPEGNRLLIETRKALLKREQKVAQLAREYRKKKGHLDEGFYDELQTFADANPLFQSGGKPWEKYKGK